MVVETPSLPAVCKQPLLLPDIVLGTCVSILTARTPTGIDTFRSGKVIRICPSEGVLFGVQLDDELLSNVMYQVKHASHIKISVIADVTIDSTPPLDGTSVLVVKPPEEPVVALVAVVTIDSTTTPPLNDSSLVMEPPVVVVAVAAAMVVAANSAPSGSRGMKRLPDADPYAKQYTTRRVRDGST